MNVRPRGKEREGQFPHGMGVVPQLLHWTLSGFGGCLCLPVGLHPECWLETEISPWPPVNLSSQKQNLEKSEYETLSVSSGCRQCPVWLPHTQWMAWDIPRCHGHRLRCGIRTRRGGLDSLLSNMNWNFCHSGHGCYLQSYDQPPAQ